MAKKIASKIQQAEFEINTAEFARAFAAVKWAAMTDKEADADAGSPALRRTYLTGLLIETAPGELILTTADGTKLSTTTIDGTWPGELINIILPMKAVEKALTTKLSTILFKVYGDSATEGGGHAWLDAQQVELIPGTFPNVRAVIPKTHDWLVQVDAEALLRAVQMVSVLAPLNGLVHFTFAKNTIKLMAECRSAGNDAPDRAEGEIDMAVNMQDSRTSNEPLTVGFNFHKLTAYLKTADRKALIGIRGQLPRQPVEFYRADLPDYVTNNVTLIMPMRTDISIEAGRWTI